MHLVFTLLLNILPVIERVSFYSLHSFLFMVPLICVRLALCLTAASDVHS